MSQAKCPECGETSRPHLEHNVPAGSELTKKKLSELGVPPYDIVRVASEKQEHVFLLASDHAIPSCSNQGNVVGFEVACDCGKQIGVDGGRGWFTGRLRLAGCEVNVPLLSELRRSAGKGAYETSSYDKVRNKVAQGELPADECVVCGGPGDPVYCTATLETTVWRKRFGDGCLFLILFAPVFVFFLLLGFIFLLFPGSHGRLHGHAKWVDVPFKLCSACRGPTRELKNQKRLKELMRNVPDYAELLDEYPDAKMMVSETAPLKTRF